MYAISIADGKKKKVGNETYDLDNTMGVAVSSADLFAGSGKSLLFLSRETGRWRKIPALSLPLEIRGVNGLAMDSDGRLWIADKAGKVIVGVTPPM
jgi:ligand-binding sensor domain-containing protein